MLTYAEAKQKSRYGGYLHIAWQNKDSRWVADKLTQDTLKQAMLDSGTQGMFVCFNRGTSHIVWWSLATMWLRNMKKGYFTFRY